MEVRGQRSAVSKNCVLTGLLFFHSLLSGFLLALCFPAEAQPLTKIPRIGYLTAAFPERIEAFRQGLRELGYLEGKSVVIEYRYAQGKLDRLPALAAELVLSNARSLLTWELVDFEPVDTKVGNGFTVVFRKRVHGPGRQAAYGPMTGEQNRLRYLLYLPPKFFDLSGKRWPVLCFLHGIGEAATDKSGAPQSIDALFNHGSPPWHCQVNSPLVHDFIVLSPQRAQRGSWDQQDFREIIQILEGIYKDFSGDRNRTYLTGFSAGGKAVFDFVDWGAALQESDKQLQWNALWPVDEASEQARASCTIQRVWLYFGMWKPRLQNETVAKLGLQPVDAFRNRSPVSAVRRYTDLSRFEYGHGATCAAAYSDWRVYQWLLAN